MPPTLTLVQTLAAAVADDDSEATFTACAALAERIGHDAATAVAWALADEIHPTTNAPTLVSAETVWCD